MAFASTTTLVVPASASGTRGADATGASAFAAASQPDMLALSSESRVRGGTRTAQPRMRTHHTGGGGGEKVPKPRK